MANKSLANKVPLNKKFKTSYKSKFFNFVGTWQGKFAVIVTVMLIAGGVFTYYHVYRQNSYAASYYYPVAWSAVKTSLTEDTFLAARGGNDHRHAGVDIIHAVGTYPTVYAVTSGKVVRSGCSGGGCYLYIQSGIWFFGYQHMKTLSVSTNASVTAGQKVGTSGGTNVGSNGNHLHFNIMSMSPANISTCDSACLELPWSDYTTAYGTFFGVYDKYGVKKPTSSTQIYYYDPYPIINTWAKIGTAVPVSATTSVITIPAAAPTETLKKGSNGNNVVILQKVLNLESTGGYGLVTDGVFGSNTDSAVRSYQSKHSLDSDGIVGSKTWASLWAVK